MIPRPEHRLERARVLRERGVPVLVIGQDIVYGYDPDRARALIAAAGYRVIAH